MKKLLTLIMLIGAVVASAQIVTTVSTKTALADYMLSDTAFVTDVLLADKAGSFADFVFDGALAFTAVPTSELILNPGDALYIDYLGRSAADRNDFNLSFGIADVVLFEHYGVLSGLDSVFVETTETQILSFWNADVSKDLEGLWSDPNHFKTFYAPALDTDFYLLFVDDRGNTNPALQDWNDGVFLVTHTFMGDITIPEPSTIGFLAAGLVLGITSIRRRR